MKKLLFITVLIFLVSACDKMPGERVYIESNDNVSPPIVSNGNNDGLENNGEDEHIESLIKPPPFMENKAPVQAPIQRKKRGEDVLAILNEVEKILSECDSIEGQDKENVPRETASFSSPPPLIDAYKLKHDIDVALRSEGLNGVSAEVDDDLDITLKGTVGCLEEKNKAFEVTRFFTDAKSLRDLVFIVQIKEDRI